MVRYSAGPSAALFARRRGDRLFHWFWAALFVLSLVVGYFWADVLALWLGAPIEFVKGVLAIPALVLMFRGNAQISQFRLRRGPPPGQVLSDDLHAATAAVHAPKAQARVTHVGISIELPHNQFVHWDDVQWFMMYSAWRGALGARAKVRYVLPNGTSGILKLPVETRDREETARFQAVLSQYWPGWDRPRDEQPNARGHFALTDAS